MYVISSKSSKTIAGYRCTQIVETRHLSQPWTLTATMVLSDYNDHYPAVGTSIVFDGRSYRVTSVQRNTNGSEHTAHIRAVLETHLGCLFAPSFLNKDSLNLDVTKIYYNNGVSLYGHTFTAATNAAQLMAFFSNYIPVSLALPTAVASRPLGVPLPIWQPMLTTLKTVAELLSARLAFSEHHVTLEPIPSASGTLVITGPVLQSDVALDISSWGRTIRTLEKKILVTYHDGYLDGDTAGSLLPSQGGAVWTFKADVTLPFPPSPIPITLATPEPYLPVSGSAPSRKPQQWLVFAQREKDDKWEQLSVTVVAQPDRLLVYGLPEKAHEDYRRLRFVGAWSIWGTVASVSVPQWSSLSALYTSVVLQSTTKILVSSLTPYAVTSDGGLDTWGATVLEDNTSGRADWLGPYLSGSILFAGDTTYSLGDRYANIQFTRKTPTYPKSDTLSAPTTITAIERSYAAGQLTTRLVLGHG